jgi:transcriptional regulator with XRE-family HTH domain
LIEQGVIYMKLGEIINNYRIQNKMTMQEFAARASLSKGYVSMLEKNHHPQSQRELVPSIETYQKIAHAMGISIDELISQLDGNETVRLNGEPTLTLVPAKSASVPQHAPDLPPDEQRLLDIYRDLSDDGKAALLNYAEERTLLEEYKKRSPNKRDKLPEGSGSDQLRENMKYDYSPLPSTVVAESASSKYKKGK